MPYLSQTNSIQLNTDCYKLLNKNGLIYISFVEGNPSKSGFQAGSSGDSCYFYFHSLNDIKNRLSLNNFDIYNIFEIEYEKLQTKKDNHTILLAKKINIRIQCTTFHSSKKKISSPF